MIVKIELERMEFHAYHGCYDTEKVVGNRFTVDLAMDVRTGNAPATDSLEGTVNYVAVYAVVEQQMRTVSNTIENVAFRIDRALRDEFPQIVALRIKVSKYAPPLGGKVERVAVTIDS